ncbi:hypothetical protein V5O48_010182 [Marasmius crinis-equi]|uniref:Uncharacterized protein n=1 Tax=Marasmius crinis-equi TaxID=585013 RepID=A0ABR3F9E0_9AGAR
MSKSCLYSPNGNRQIHLRRRKARSLDLMGHRIGLPRYDPTYWKDDNAANREMESALIGMQAGTIRVLKPTAESGSILSYLPEIHSTMKTPSSGTLGNVSFTSPGWSIRRFRLWLQTILAVLLLERARRTYCLMVECRGGNQADAALDDSDVRREKMVIRLVPEE